MHHALYFPPFGELADPAVLGDIAEAAESGGWEGMFLWDHVLRPSSEPPEIADVWIALAVVAIRSSTLRIGPMVTPLVRRRVAPLVRQVLSLERLSLGRLTLGLGLGVDSGRELTAFGEITDTRARGDLLDEVVPVLRSLLDGEMVTHRGPHATVDGVSIPPTSQRPLPFWLAARGTASRPVRRAARYEGLFPLEVDRDGLARMLDVIATERGDLDGFDVAVLMHSGVDLEPLAELGATWAMHSFRPGDSASELLAAASAGPDR